MSMPYVEGRPATVIGTPPASAESREVARRPRRALRTVLAGTLAIAGLGGCQSRPDTDPDAGGQAAGGPAPAVSPSNRKPTAIESAAASPTATKRHSGSASCFGLKVTRPDDTLLHITPKIKKTGNPDSSRYVTVVEVLSGANPTDRDSRIYAGYGLGTAVNIQVPADLSLSNSMALVSVAYFPPGKSQVPADPSELAAGNPDSGRVLSACGNAVTTLLVQNGDSNVHPG